MGDACISLMITRDLPASFFFHRCQRESQGINYVAFLGDKYGRLTYLISSAVKLSFFKHLLASNFHKS